VAGAASNLVRQMVDQFGSRADCLTAAITPSAGPCCYEVGDEVRRVASTRLAEAEACFVERDGRFLFDLWRANRRQLIDGGVPAEQIETAGLCSMCDDRFWSHRRDGADAGRFGLIVALH
jgi:copper oxidase (laccase) domain-containing protein